MKYDVAHFLPILSTFGLLGTSLSLFTKQNYSSSPSLSSINYLNSAISASIALC